MPTLYKVVVAFLLPTHILGPAKVVQNCFVGKWSLCHRLGHSFDHRAHIPVRSRRLLLETFRLPIWTSPSGGRGILPASTYSPGFAGHCEHNL